MGAGLPGIAGIARGQFPLGSEHGRRERNRNAFTVTVTLAIGQRRLERQPRLRQPRGIDIHDGRRADLIGEGEPPARGGNPAAGGDDHPAVVDRAARLVAEQVGIHIGRPEGPRPLQHEPAADLVLAEGKMARRRVEDQVHAPRGQPRPGPVSRPGIFADLEADTDAATVESEVTERHAPPVDGQQSTPPFRPRSKPSRLIVDALARKMLLAGDARQPAIRQHRGRVIDAVLKPHRQPDGHDDAGCMRHDLLEHPPRHPLHARRLEGVLTAVAADAELRQAEDRDTAIPRRRDRRDDAVTIAVPIKRRLVEGGAAHTDQVHGCYSEYVGVELSVR